MRGNVLYYCLLVLSIGLLFSCHTVKKENSENPFKQYVDPQFSTLSEGLNKYVKENKVSGGVGLVYKEDKIVFHSPFGYQNIERREAFTNDAIFRIASMTKPITAVAAMILYERGKFKLDEPVSKYLPEFEHLSILESINSLDSTYTSRPAKEEMVIRQLFTFSSGLYYGFDIDSLSLIFSKAGISEGFEEREMILEDNIRHLAELPLLHEPGERYHYGLEMDVLGRLVEVWSGKPLDLFFKREIFEPLGMHDTYFYLPKEKEKRLTQVYMNEGTEIKVTNYPLIHYPIEGARSYFSGGADLSSTAYDYFLFCKMILQKGELNGKRILNPETVSLISQTHLETGDNDMGLGFGLLSAKTEVNLARSIGSITWGGFFNTTFWIDPQKEIIGILMLQMYPFDHWKIQEDFENLIYEIVNR